MTQYLQLISNTSSPTPLDVWLPSDNFIKPQIADQVALGCRFQNDNYSLEWNLLQKVKNRLDYIDGADLIANKAIEQIILNGQLRSYGLEVMLQKQRKTERMDFLYLIKIRATNSGRTAENQA
jgi:hypothetical protein